MADDRKVLIEPGDKQAGVDLVLTVQAVDAERIVVAKIKAWRGTVRPVSGNHCSSAS